MPEDASGIWRLIGEIGTLERNTAYAYVLLATYFRETVLVARSGGTLVGVVIGFIVPDRPDTLFIWQVGVAPQARGRGVGLALLSALAERLRDRGLAYVEATVTPDNAPSQSLFRRFAEGLAAAYRIQPGFGAHLFPGGAHEPERLVRIGPFSSNSPNSRPRQGG